MIALAAIASQSDVLRTLDTGIVQPVQACELSTGKDRQAEGSKTEESEMSLWEHIVYRLIWATSTPTEQKTVTSFSRQTSYRLVPSLLSGEQLASL